MKMFLLIFSLFFFSQLDAQREERITVSSGETATFRCIYQGDSIKHPKFFCKWTDKHCTEMVRTLASPRGRFSITEDHRKSRVTVSISDVREEDGGVYSCGGWKESGTKLEDRITVNMLHLRVTGERPPVKPTTPKIPTAARPRSSSTPTSETTSKESPSRPTGTAPSAGSAVTSTEERSTPPPHSSAAAIITCICVVLLLIGGLILIFYILRRSKTPGAAGNNDKIPSNPPVPDICSTAPQPESSTQSVKYITVNFKKNPLNPTDPPSETSKEKFTTQYATVKYHTHQK